MVCIITYNSLSYAFQFVGLLFVMSVQFILDKICESNSPDSILWMNEWIILLGWLHILIYLVEG